MKDSAKSKRGRGKGRMTRSPRETAGWPIPLIYIGLTAITWIVFSQTLGNDFINYDDNLYVYQNPSVKSGLTIPNLVTAVTRPLVGNWHPLTAISLMLDAQFFGLHASGYHFDNVLFHTVAVLLLFIVLRKMTGAVWRSAFVAALFAIHPLRVESVAWISERKDVLSGVFFMLTLGAYIRYTRQPLALGRYLFVIATFTLGLLAKSMLVTVPFVLLLLDYWPLQRFAFPFPSGRWRAVSSRLILEKLPFLMVAAAVSVATLWAQEPALEPSQAWPLGWRVNNALLTIWSYLRQMIWPTHLAVFYPHPEGDIPFWQVSFALLFLVVVSAAVVAWRKKYPYLVTGWFWYLGMLIPVIGLIQVGLQAHADRYTYLPQIGIYLMISWGIADLTKSWRLRPVAVGSVATLVIVVLMSVAWKQAGYWSNSERLWSHALDVTRNNFVAERGLGTALLKRGQVDQAIAHQREALRLRPGDANILTNLANALVQKREFAEAIDHYRQVIRLRPNDNEAYRNLAKALLQNGATEEAVAELREALRLQPKDSDAAYSLGNAFLQKGELDEAIGHYRKAIEANPSHSAAHYNLALTLQQKGRLDEAIAEFRETLRLQPNNAEAHNNLAIILLKKGETQDAIAEWQSALQIQPQNADVHNNLAVAFLRERRTSDALAEWQETLRLRPDKTATQISLAWVLATFPDPTIRDGNKAIALAQRAYQTAADRNLMIFRVLAAAYAETGRFREAIAAAAEGAQRAEERGQLSIARFLQGDRALYEQGVPLRELSGNAGLSP